MLEFFLETPQQQSFSIENFYVYLRSTPGVTRSRSPDILQAAILTYCLAAKLLCTNYLVGCLIVVVSRLFAARLVITRLPLSDYDSICKYRNVLISDRNTHFNHALLPSAHRNLRKGHQQEAGGSCCLAHSHDQRISTQMRMNKGKNN